MTREKRLLVDVRPLRVGAFRRLWAAGIVTALGAQLTAVVVPLQIYEFSGSSACVGLAGLVGLAPMAPAALWGGALADVRDRRRLLLTTTVGIGVTSSLLWAQAWANLRSVGVLLVLVGVQQALFGANSTVSRAVTPRLVPPELVPAANALQSVVLLSAGIAGPLLAAGLLPVAGSGTLYLADALAVCATVWAVWRLPALPPLGGRERGQGPVPRRIMDGVRFVTRRQLLLAVYLSDFAALSLGLPTALFPQLAAETFRPSDIGVLYAAVSAGGVLAGLFSGAFTRIRRHGVAVAVSVGVWGLALAGFGLARSLVTAVAWLLLAGGALLALGVFRKTVLQTAVPDGMRGRLQGIDTVVAVGGPRLGDLLHGTVGAALGVTWTVTGGGVLTVGAALALVLLFPVLRHHRAPAGSEKETLGA
ncbi:MULTISPECIES: MFS transporter [unclassified Streptomyces]|uniref:MFS transporter n=1 Tax=unclassified Streptomyces TaxID=2593676 RepID=UPI0024743077|nr:MULTISPECIES: MFS transporter [unclassified Streptomyces]MDH6447809.1 MFS family permease [Streptomyces sp. SAI-119]MDH6501468.1 MFS family permease [Streptomyces sp. SAI-149]